MSDAEAALRLYIIGERLCDEGQVQSGIRSFQRAFELCPELEQEEWPDAIAELHAALLVAECEPPVVEGTNDFQPALAEHCKDGQAWWASDVALDAIAATLRADGFAILDGFVGSEGAARLRAACQTAWEADEFQPSRPQVADAIKGTPPPARSDLIAWDPAGFAGDLSTRTDALMTALIERHPKLLGHVTRRQRPMVARYGHGDAFARHVDNHGHNGREVTACYYMQEPDGWDARAAGGCLRLFRSQQGAPANEETEALVDVAPLSDRLLLFFSDFRCPHEVLPVRRPGAVRFGATIWYWGERDVPEWWVDGVHDRTLLPLNLPSPVCVRRAHL